MFLQLVTPPSPFPPIPTPPLSATTQAGIDSLFQYHPLQISAIVETVWQNRYNAGDSTPFAPWPLEITYPILSYQFYQGYNVDGGIPITLPSGYAFTVPIAQPGLVGTPSPGTLPPMQQTNWDHLIYAYLIENTRIFDIFSKVLDTYMSSEELEMPSPASQRFWRNVECLIYGDAMPTMVWTTSGRAHRDEVGNRLTAYYRMFGVDLSHAQEIAVQHPYRKPAASNADFIPTFETFAREVWRGIVNAKNVAGPKDTDDQAIATSATRLFDMMTTRRMNGNLSREEFRAVAVMSFLHLAVLYDSPAVEDLKANASSPEQRLAKIANRVGMKPHSQSKALFDLSQPMSFLMQAIEGQLPNNFNDPTYAHFLYDQPPASTNISSFTEMVIDQYCTATGRDLKASAVAVTQRATTPRMRPLPPPPAAQRVNGRTTHALGS